MSYNQFDPMIKSHYKTIYDGGLGVEGGIESGLLHRT